MNPCKKQKLNNESAISSEFFPKKNFCLIRWRPDIREGLTLSIVNRLNLSSKFSISKKSYQLIKDFNLLFEGLVLFVGIINIEFFSKFI